MTQKNIQVEGLNELIDGFSTANVAIQQESARFLRSWSIFAVNEEQKNLLSSGAVDTMELLDGIHYELSSNGLESVIKPSEAADEYAIFVEKGSRPHWPPIDALQGWADRHGIPVWAVARSIAKKGTKAKPTWDKTFNATKTHVDSEINDFMDAIFRKL